MSETPVDPDSPMWKSWVHYKQSGDYRATVHWAQYPKHLDGSMRAVYIRGYDDGLCARGGNAVAIAMVAGFCTAVGFMAGWLWM